MSYAQPNQRNEFDGGPIVITNSLMEVLRVPTIDPLYTRVLFSLRIGEGGSPLQQLSLYQAATIGGDMVSVLNAADAVNDFETATNKMQMCLPTDPLSVEDGGSIQLLIGIEGAAELSLRARSNQVGGTTVQATARLVK